MAGNADNVKQLLLMVDASVALAQRNIASLVKSVDTGASQMDASLKKVDAAFDHVGMGMTPQQAAKFFTNAQTSAKELLSQIDPLYAAQTRYNEALAKLHALRQAEAIDDAQLARSSALLAQQLKDQQVYYGRITQGSTAMRVGMQQLTFQIGDVAQGFALGTKPMVIFAQQSGQVLQALQLMGHSGNAFLKFLAGPWGIALQLAASALLLLTVRTKDAGKSVDDLVAKMRKQYDEAQNQEEANARWAKSIDGVIEAQDKLNKTLSDSLKVESDVNFERLQKTQDSLQKMHIALDQFNKELDAAKAEKKTAEALPATSPGAPAYANAALTAARDEAIARAQSKIDFLNDQIGKLNVKIKNTEQGVVDAQFAIGHQIGQYATDTGKAFSDLIDTQRAITENNKSIAASAGDVDAAFEELRKAAQDADSQGALVGVAGDASQKVADLAEKLRTNKITVATFASEIAKLTNQLNSMAEAARKAKKDAGDPIANFKRDVIGAEGTGPNQMGSSAFGLGQFTKDTWLTYFDRLFPDKAALTESAKLGLRNVREVANAVIDKATDDYVKVLNKAGQSITEANLYTVHVLGEPAAKKFFAASNDASARSVVGSTVVAKNGNIFTGTVGQAKAELARRIGDSSGAVSGGAIAIDRILAEEAKRVQKQWDDYVEAEDRLNQQLVDAQGELTDNIQEQADNAVDAVNAQRKRLANQIDNDIAEGKYGDATEQATQLRGEQLRLLNDQIADQKIANIREKERRQLVEQQDQFDQQDFEIRIENLRAQEGMARTNREKRTLELQILDLVYEEKKKHLEVLFNLALAAKNYGEAAKIAAELANLPNQKFNDTQQALRSTQGPLDQYLDSLPRTNADINQRLESIEVSGIQHAVDVLADFRKGWKAMRDDAISALDDIIGQLIKLKLEEWVAKIFKAKDVAGTAGKDGAGLASAGSALKDSGVQLAASGTQLNTAGMTLNQAAVFWQQVAIQLQAAATQLAAANAMGGGGGGGLGGLASLVGGGLGGGDFGTGLTGDFLTGGFSIDTGLGGLDSLGSGLFDDFLTGGFSVATFGSGGKVTGRGTGQSDSIAAYLSNGEYVMSNAAVSALGTPVLDALNKGDASALKQLCNCGDDGGGGLLGGLLGSGLFGLAGLALGGKNIGMASGIFGLAGLGLAGKIHFADGGPVGYRSMMPRASSMRGYGRGGRSITIGDVHAPLIVNGEMDAKTMRKTQAQHSSNMRREVAEAVRKGLTQ